MPRSPIKIKHKPYVESENTVGLRWKIVRYFVRIQLPFYAIFHVCHIGQIVLLSIIRYAALFQRNHLAIRIGMVGQRVRRVCALIPKEVVFFFFWQSLVDCQPLLARIKGKASSGQNGWLFIWTFNGRKFWLALCGGAWVGGRFSVPLAARSPHFYTITWNHYFSGWGKLSIRLDSC